MPFMDQLACLLQVHSMSIVTMQGPTSKNNQAQEQNALTISSGGACVKSLIWKARRFLQLKASAFGAKIRAHVGAGLRHAQRAARLTAC
jgi:hypothetical protein